LHHLMSCTAVSAAAAESHWLSKGTSWATLQSHTTAEAPAAASISTSFRAPQSFNTLQRQMTRANYEGLYDQAKSLLCCTLADGTRDAWVAYTVASAFAGAHIKP
jgi:hypothetical protein